jgi:hypothetical protein
MLEFSGILRLWMKASIGGNQRFSTTFAGALDFLVRSIQVGRLWKLLGWIREDKLIAEI